MKKKRKYTKAEMEKSLQRAMQDDIEIALEEFEDYTGKKVVDINIKRYSMDKEKDHKISEYDVTTTLD